MAGAFESEGLSLCAAVESYMINSEDDLALTGQRYKLIETELA